MFVVTRIKGKIVWLKDNLETIRKISPTRRGKLGDRVVLVEQRR
jgi:hypothetical protein